MSRGVGRAGTHRPSGVADPEALQFEGYEPVFPGPQAHFLSEVELVFPVDIGIEGPKLVLPDIQGAVGT